MMGAVAKNSKQFFHLSGEYFDSQGRGMLQLQGPMEMFTGPKLASEINFGAKEFTLSAWVSVRPQFLDGYEASMTHCPATTCTAVVALLPVVVLFAHLRG